MELKKHIFIILLVLFVFVLIGSVSAADIGANDTQIASVSDNDDILSVENDVDVLSDDGQYNYSDLKDQIKDGGNIILTKGYYTYNNDGDTIQIVNSGVIDGNGAVIDMNGSGIRALFVNANLVTIKNLTIKNAKFNDVGGAIYFNGNLNKVENCNFINNSASHGGAIRFNGEGFIVINCNFTNNSAGYGGAINIVFSNTAAEVTNCSFADNSASENGGAIFFNGAGTVTSCNFANNNASNNGGAISFSYYSNVTDCNFTNNSASENGGAVFFNGAGTVTSCNFTNNSASSGGAIFFKGAGTVTSCNFTNNNASNNGGAIYFNGDINNITVLACFKGNNAERAGGAIYVKGKSINNNFSSQFYDNNARRASGGAIFFYSLAENNSFESIFMNNYALYGGGIFFYKTANDNKFNSNFTLNVAESCGGAVFFYNTTNNNNFTGYFINNSALGKVNETLGNGGAITFKDVSTNCIFNCEFINNTAAKNGGGVNYRQTPHNITFNGNFISNNASIGGGVNFFESFENIIFNGEFISNSAINGGAIAAGAGSINEVSFKNNRAKNGGAVYFSNGSCIVENCNFTGNNATKGSAIYFDSDSAIKTISNSTFLNNRADAESFEVIPNENNVTILFTGQDNLLNAIYSAGDVNFTNVTYWGANGINNTDSYTPSRSNREAGQNITVVGFVNGRTLNMTKITNSNGAIVIDDIDGDYCFIASHNADLYYTEAEKIISNIDFCVNVTSMTTVNRTVNITAKSNIPNDLINGELLFILPNGTVINATYDSDGTWWVLHIFDDVGDYNITASYIGLDDVKINNGIIFVREDAEVTAEDIEVVFNKDNTIVVSTNPDGLKLIFESANSTIAVVDADGKVTGKSAGSTTITITIDGEGIYYNNKTAIEVTVKKGNLTISAAADTIVVGENATVVVTGLENATGNVSARVGDGIYFGDIINGTANIIVPGLIVNTTAEIYYGGDDNYNDASTSRDIIVNKNLIISAPDLIKYYKGPEKFVVTVTDGRYNPLVNKSVNITINGVTYYKSTDEKGTVSLNINLNSGEYPVNVAVGDENVNSTVIVKATIDASDVTKVFKNSTQYYATFVDVNGTPLDHTTVSFNINGRIYNRTTDENGTALMNINLGAGDYIITAINPVTGEMKSNSIKVISMIESGDLTKHYKNDSQFVVRLHSDNGSYVGAGEEVKFNINGIFYTRTTNATGHATLNINLPQGNYTVTTYYKDCSHGNAIEVLPILNASDLEMKYKDGSQFKAKLVDGEGNPYPNQNVTFNINGIFYNRTTDSDGVAKLNINLMPGEYIITSSYNGSNIANTITIKS